MEPLTPRESQVLRLIAEGFTDREIGDRLGRSFQTIHVHREAVRRKLGARTAAHAVTLGFLTGLLEIED